MINASKTKRPSGGQKKRKNKERLFLISVWVYPVVLFCLLYVYVNFSSIMLAFQRLNPETYKYEWNGIENFKTLIHTVFNDNKLSYTMSNTFMVFFISVLIQIPINIVTAFLVYKGIYWSNLFKVVLFLTNIISSIVWVLLFKYIVEYGLPAIWGKLGGNPDINLLGDPSKSFATMIIYAFWIQLGGRLLIYLGSMTRIPESLIESGKLEGMGLLRELWHITIPLVFPVVSISIITAVAGFFSNQLYMYAFYADGADYRTYTFGYYLFSIVVGKSRGGEGNYAYAAAAGVILTLITAPVTLIVRHLLEKYGPNAEY